MFHCLFALAAAPVNGAEIAQGAAHRLNPGVRVSVSVIQDHRAGTAMAMHWYCAASGER